MPVDQDPDGQRLERISTTIPKREDTSHRLYSCTFGTSFTVGLGVVSALCRVMDVEVCSGDVQYRQSFSRGVPATKLERSNGCVGSGTTIHFEPDPDIFETDDWEIDIVLLRLQELACLVPDIAINFSQEPVVIGADSDLRTLVKRIAARSPGWGGDPIALEGSNDGRSSARLALLWRKPYWRTEPELDLEPVVHLWCNLHHSPWLGPHMNGLGEGLSKVFGVGSGDTEHFVRLTRGLVAAINLVLPAPTWTGQTRDDLVNPEAAELVRQLVVDQLPGFLAAMPELAEDLRSRAAPRQDRKPWPVQRQKRPAF
jgi:DNA gyrase subunit B